MGRRSLWLGSISFLPNISVINIIIDGEEDMPSSLLREIVVRWNILAKPTWINSRSRKPRLKSSHGSVIISDWISLVVLNLPCNCCIHVYLRDTYILNYEAIYLLVARQTWDANPRSAEQNRIHGFSVRKKRHSFKSVVIKNGRRKRTQVQIEFRDKTWKDVARHVCGKKFSF